MPGPSCFCFHFAADILNRFCILRQNQNSKYFIAKQATADYIPQAWKKILELFRPTGSLVVIKQNVKSEAYESSEDVLRHQFNLGELIVEIFRKFGTHYSVSICGDPSPEVMENARAGNFDSSYFHY